VQVGALRASTRCAAARRTALSRVRADDDVENDASALPAVGASPNALHRDAEHHQRNS
jgi:hypothetical protein